jgi:hypothetical protein
MQASVEATKEAILGWNGDKEMAERKRVDVPIEAPLRRRVAGGLIMAALLTAFLGFSSWHSARRAEQDGYWVSHTYEVMATIQLMSRHVIEAETSARAFALSGQEPLLVHYQTARDTIYQDDGGQSQSGVAARCALAAGAHGARIWRKHHRQTQEARTLSGRK